MTPLIIDSIVRQDIKDLITFAFKPENVVYIAELMKSGELKKGMPNPIGDKDGHTIIIPANFKVVYSLEDQGKGIDGKIGLGLCRHLSMSVGIIGRVPNPIGLDMIVEEFGFNGPIYQCIFWAEEFGRDDQKAFNVLEPVNGWTDNSIKRDVENDGTRRLGLNMVTMIKQRRSQSVGKANVTIPL